MKNINYTFFKTYSLVTVNELAAGDQNQSANMELIEGEISNTSALIDPNETQLPTGILKFPTNEIIDIINQEIDEDYYIANKDDYSPSPKTPMDIVNNRVKEYEELIRALKDSKKQKSNVHQELLKLKEELASRLMMYQETRDNLDVMQSKVEKYSSQVEQLKNETAYWKMEAEKQGSESKIDLVKLQDHNKRLEKELSYWKDESSHQENDDAPSLKTRLAETNNILEDLRITHGQTKERLRESMKENLALKSCKAKKKDAEKGLEQLCMNYQDEIEELKRQLTDLRGKEEESKAISNEYESLKGMFNLIDIGSGRGKIIGVGRRL